MSAAQIARFSHSLHWLGVWHKSQLKKTGKHYKIVILWSSLRYLQIATIQLGDDTGVQPAFRKQ